MTQAKAKCPGCGDTDKEQPEYINSMEWISDEYSVRLICSECLVVSSVLTWIRGPEPDRPHVEAIARRVVELMGEAP